MPKPIPRIPNFNNSCKRNSNGTNNARISTSSFTTTSRTAYKDQIHALDAARDAEYQRVLGTNVFAALQKEQAPATAR